MVYEWDQYRDECFRLYITERKSLEEIMAYLKEQHNFAPSKRAFQTQFRKWEFPSKQNPAHRNVDLVTRVHQLWEQNYTQRDMIKTLTEEGFTIKERELMRVRAKNRWLLRIPNGQKPTPEEASFQAELLAAAEEVEQESAASLLRETTPEEIVRKRKERHEKMQAESAERWAAKKRRRRTREYAGIPADPPGPPRFPSETTLGESMQLLTLNGDLYKQARLDFQNICEDMRIIKKTLAGSDKWSEAKNRLIQDNKHLNEVFSDVQNRAAKELALDVIATDVTKRMRTVEQRMTIVDAKNILGLNPEQSRQIRASFYIMLERDHFTSKLETGPEHWENLKSIWVQKEPILSNLGFDEQDSPEIVKKRKALEIIARDVMKRLRDAQKKDDPQPVRTKASAKAPTKPKPMIVSIQEPIPAQDNTFDISDLQIDPSLLQQEDFIIAPQSESVSEVAIHIKPHPQSQTHGTTKMFLSTLKSRSHDELKNIILDKWPNTTLQQIQGLAKGDTADVHFAIEDDDELEAYLEHVQGAKVVFLVQVNKA